jgi:hypothetical protein
VHPARELRSLAFTLTTSDVTRARSSQSLVYAALPGKMRVDLQPASSRSGTVRDRQRLAVFRAGQRVSTTNRVDLRTLLAFDVFAQSIDTTIMWLDSTRMRFGLHRRDEWEGRSVWVVGAEEGDAISTQFWVDAREWRVVRVIQREPRSPSLISDVRYLEFTKLLNVPVPTRIQVWQEGTLVEEQRLTEFTVNPSLPRSTFDMGRWRTITLGTRSTMPRGQRVAQWSVQPSR